MYMAEKHIVMLVYKWQHLMNPGTLNSTLLYKISFFSKHHWSSTIQCEYLQYQALYLQYQPKQLIIPVKKAMPK